MTQFVNSVPETGRFDLSFAAAENFFRRSSFQESIPETDSRNRSNATCLGSRASAKLRRMSEALAVDAPDRLRAPLVLTFIRTSAPSLREAALTSSSAVLLVLSFPNFDLWWLAWIGLAPLLFAVSMASRIRSAFVLGLLWGTIFFYGTCWWLTYPMTRFRLVCLPAAPDSRRLRLSFSGTGLRVHFTNRQTIRQRCDFGSAACLGIV